MLGNIAMRELLCHRCCAESGFFLLLCNTIAALRPFGLGPAHNELKRGKKCYFTPGPLRTMCNFHDFGIT